MLKHRTATSEEGVSLSMVGCSDTLHCLAKNLPPAVSRPKKNILSSAFPRQPKHLLVAKTRSSLFPSAKANK
jgi:hypothetical protein